MMRPKPFPNSAAEMAAPASRALISLQSAFPVRPQVLPNRKLHWRSSSKPASNLCVLVCTHEAGFLSRDDAAPTDLLVRQRPASTSALASTYVAAKDIRQAAATDGNVTWVADNSAHPIDPAVIDVITILVVCRERGFEQNPDHRPRTGCIPYRYPSGK